MIDEMTNLFTATTEREVIECLNRGDDINQLIDGGATPFIYHCESGREEVAIALIKYGCDVNFRYHGFSGLDFAAFLGYTSLLMEMITYPDIPNLINPDRNLAHYKTPLTCCAEKGYMDIYDTLVSKEADVNLPNSEGETPLFVASGYDQLDMVKALLRDGADPNIADNREDVPLFWTKSPKVIEQLITYGADPNYIDSGEISALHFHTSHPDITETLLKFGANPNFRAEYGDTPLLLALRMSSFRDIDDAKKYLTTAKILLKYGADPYITNYDNRSAIEIINDLPPDQKEFLDSLN